jgi:hypothetical protein
MPTTLYCMPLKEGKTETYKAFIKDCVEQKTEDYKALLMRYGLNNVKMWIHTIEGKDYAMFVHDMDDDAHEKLAGWPNKEYPFEVSFNECLIDCYDVDMAQFPPQPEFITHLEGR